MRSHYFRRVSTKIRVRCWESDLREMQACPFLLSYEWWSCDNHQPELISTIESSHEVVATENCLPQGRNFINSSITEGGS
ncbi:hypothetical protein CEXT_144421 [Caerostris extrusa]|uniref:Uncharacterized protein n=1 Tax=Caerostris extrusa TaxID=172846 RepID=A0AAV4Y981_CAEEX|nr:hypothetical protein CEXT_144421 [Caerostris extrusa]